MKIPFEIDFNPGGTWLKSVTLSPKVSQLRSLIHQLERSAVETQRLRDVKRSILNRIRLELKQDGG